MARGGPTRTLTTLCVRRCPRDEPYFKLRVQSVGDTLEQSQGSNASFTFKPGNTGLRSAGPFGQFCLRHLALVAKRDDLTSDLKLGLELLIGAAKLRVFKSSFQIRFIRNAPRVSPPNVRHRFPLSLQVAHPALRFASQSAALASAIAIAL